MIVQLPPYGTFRIRTGKRPGEWQFRSVLAGWLIGQEWIDCADFMNRMINARWD